MFRTKIVEIIETHVLCSTTFFFFFKNRAIYEIMWKNTVDPGQAIDNNVAHAHYMLVT
jgi:hypothetical protein